jgi:hypothetical protein
VEDVVPEIYCRGVAFPNVVGRVLQEFKEFQKRRLDSRWSLPSRKWVRE